MKKHYESAQIKCYIVKNDDIIMVSLGGADNFGVPTWYGEVEEELL